MTNTTDPRALVEELRKDVFYGDERMHKFNQHNPLHMHAADALLAALDRAEKAEARGRVAGLREAAEICADYQEWCDGWGEAKNATTAETAAKECSKTILALIPATSPTKT